MTTQPTPPSQPPPGFPGGTAPFAPVAPEPFYTPPAPPARKAGSGAQGLTIALAVAVLIAGCGISFALGRATAPAAATSGAAAGPVGQGTPGDPNAGIPASGGPLASGGTVPNASFGLNGNQGGDDNGRAPGAGGFGGLGGPSIQGTVAATDGTTITLTLAGGRSLTVKVDANTKYAQQAAGSASDVSVGKTVIVSLGGRFNLDGQGGGSTARTVTVVP